MAREWTEENRQKLRAMFEEMNLTEEQRAQFDPEVLRGDRPLKLEDKWLLQSIQEERWWAKLVKRQN